MVAGLLRQDQDALEYIYDAYSSALYGVICKIVPEEAIAQEVLQDLFLKIWNKIHQYDAEKGKLFTWMLNIARNLAFDKIKSSEYKHSHQSVSTMDVVYSSETVEAILRTENNTDTLDVSDLLNKLKPEQREIVELMYLKGYTQSEISEEFGIPLGTVKTRVKSAMNYLRSFF